MDTNAVLTYPDPQHSASSLSCSGYYDPYTQTPVFSDTRPGPYFSHPSEHLPNLPESIQPEYVEVGNSGFYCGGSHGNAASPPTVPIATGSPSSGNYSGGSPQTGSGSFNSGSPVQNGSFSASPPLIDQQFKGEPQEEGDHLVQRFVVPVCSTSSYQLTANPSHLMPGVLPQVSTSVQQVPAPTPGQQYNFPSPPELSSYNQSTPGSCYPSNRNQSTPGSCYPGYTDTTFQPRYTPAEQLTPPNEVSQLQRNQIYQANSELHKNCMVAQFLATSGQFAKFFEFVTTSEFREQDHTGVQQLWLHCLYTQHAASKKTPLTAVDRHRLRKRYPYPASIWNGETTSYNLKQSARRLLAIAFSVDQYPSNEEKKHLADVCEMDYLQICNWFKNRRMREKRLQKEQKRSNPTLNSSSSSSSSPGSKSVSEAVSELELLQKSSL